MQTRHILASLRRALALLDDLVERHRRGIDDARVGRAMVKQRRGHQRTGVETDRTARDQVAAAHGDEVRRPRPGADEMHRHRPSPTARAQVVRAAAMRGPSKRLLRPAATSAAASAIDGSPVASSTRADRVRSLSDTSCKSAAPQATNATDRRRAASWKPGYCGAACARANIHPSTGCMMYYRCQVCGREFTHGDLCAGAGIR